MLSYRYINNNKKESILLLHAYGGNYNCFKKQIPTLSNFFNIINIDLHGHGASKNFPLHKKRIQSMPEVLRDINQVLIALDIKEVHLLGLSLGSMVANAFACEFPHKTISIINAGAILQFDTASQKTLSLVYKNRKIIPKTGFYSIAGLVIMPNAKHIASRAIFVKEANKMNPNDFYAWLKIMIEFEDYYNFERLLSINKPALYISGEFDHMFLKPITNLFNKSKHVKFKIINHAGHICNIEKTLQFNNLITEFFKENQKNRD